jgi:hypothetical protein
MGGGWPDRAGWAVVAWLVMRATCLDMSAVNDALVVAACRQQGRNVLDYLTSGFEANRKGRAIPSPLPAAKAEIQAA